MNQVSEEEEEEEEWSKANSTLVCQLACVARTLVKRVC